jgi:hypothetical protein
MSPTDASRFTDAATVAHLLEAAIHAPTVEDDRLTDDARSEKDPTTTPWPPRPVSPARVGPSRNEHARAFNDPSNYLG